jgi:hypothetical protein
MGKSAPMPTHSPKRSPPATRRRALELLAASPDGRTEAILVAHGFTIDMVVKLIRAGLATTGTERIVGRRSHDRGYPRADHGGGTAGNRALIGF